MEPRDDVSHSDSGTDIYVDSESSGDELPIWVHGHQRWVSGVESSTTCADLISVLLQNEVAKGISVGEAHQYHITERWRGFEQPLNNTTAIQDIWNAWGNAKEEVRISLRRQSTSSNDVGRRRCHQRESVRLWKHAHTVHPRRLFALASEHEHYGLLPHAPTNDLLKLVFAQGEIIRKQLRKLRHSENQIGLFEDITHRARVRKHGSNYVLSTYLKCLPDLVESGFGPSGSGDKNSDSGVMTEGESGEAVTSTQNLYDRLSSTSSESKEEIISVEVTNIRHHIKLWSMISEINKKILKEEELLVRLGKYKRSKNDFDQIKQSLLDLRTEVTKSAYQIQRNAVILEKTIVQLNERRLYLHNLQKELSLVDQEHEILQTLIYNKEDKTVEVNAYNSSETKELNTLV